MDSQGLIGQLKLPSRLLPLAAIITDDLRQGIRHWALVWWCGLSILLSLVWFIETPTAEPASFSSSMPTAAVDPFTGEPARQEVFIPAGAPRASTMAAKLIRLHLFLWSTLVIALAGSSIAGESESVAESVLCRGVSRWQYFLGKVISRVSLTVAAFIVLTIPIVMLCLFKCYNDLTWSGMTRAMFQGSLFLAGVATISVAAGAWFRQSLYAVAVSWMAIYGAGIILSLLQIEIVSPIRFIETVIAMPRYPEAMTSATHLLSTLGMGALAVSIVSLVGFSRRDY